MIHSSLEQEIRVQLRHLAFEQQRQVLDFARALALARTRGVPGSTLLRFAGGIDPDDLAAMTQAIEEGCEQVNLHDW